jgi:hypothetical protein
MDRWQYVTDAPVGRSNQELREAMNARGEEGWELVTIHPGAGSALLLFFKRPVGPKPRARTRPKPRV